MHIIFCLLKTFYTIAHFLILESFFLPASLTGWRLPQFCLLPLVYSQTPQRAPLPSSASPLNVEGAWGFSVGLSPLSPGAPTHSHLPYSTPAGNSQDFFFILSK